MRVKELLAENADAPGNTGGSANKMHGHHEAAIKGMETYPDLPAHYYNMYRFGVHMAGSPADQDMKAVGSVANQMVTLAYSDADQDIINKSKKALGLKGKQLTSKASKEVSDTNTVSPVAKPKKNKYGV